MPFGRLTVRTCVVFLAVAVTGCVPTGPSPADEAVVLRNDGAGQGQVTVCHYPPGNPENAQTLNVSAASLPAHLAHGDTIGPCDGEPVAECGNGAWEEGEECDGDVTPCGEDYNTCTAECLCDFVPEPDAECGNDVWEEGEECDGDATPCGGDGWFCTDGCLCEEFSTDPFCGDGHVDPGEDCDGDATTCDIGETCSEDCFCEASTTCYEATSCSGSDPACCDADTSTCSETGVCEPTPGAIQGTIWFDLDGDGSQSGSEAGTGGITVTLYADADNDGLPDSASIESTTTGTNGAYGFSGLLGSYVLGTNAAALGGCMTSGPDSAYDSSTGYTTTVTVLPSNPPDVVTVDIGVGLEACPP